MGQGLPVCRPPLRARCLQVSLTCRVGEREEGSVIGARTTCLSPSTQGTLSSGKSNM